MSATQPQHCGYSIVRLMPNVPSTTPANHEALPATVVAAVQTQTTRALARYFPYASKGACVGLMRRLCSSLGGHSDSVEYAKAAATAVYHAVHVLHSSSDSSTREWSESLRHLVLLLYNRSPVLNDTGLILKLRKLMTPPVGSALRSTLQPQHIRESSLAPNPIQKIIAPPQPQNHAVKNAPGLNTPLHRPITTPPKLRKNDPRVKISIAPFAGSIRYNCNSSMGAVYTFR